MKSRNNKQLNKVDFLVGALSNDKNFKDLLEDDIFVDYFNTFLSLPIFAKKLFYRKNLRSFEVYPGAEKPGHYYVQENIFSWVNGERGPLFLKTDICNEFRLCKLLVEELRKQNIKDGCRLDFEKELGSVLAMQRFKAFLHESAGERVLVFWLAAERYRRQTVRECRRFVLREIQEKFIQQGSWLELPHCIKSRFKLDLNTNEAEAMVPSDMKSDTLLASQVLAFTSLVEYWVPKYMSHRDHRILNIRAKWKNAAHLNEKDLQLHVDGISDKTNFYDVYKDAKEKEMKSTSSKKSNLFTSSDSVEKELDLFSNQSSSIEAFEERLNIDAHDITADRIKLCRSQTSSDSYNSDMIITIDDDDDYGEEEDEKEKAAYDSSSHFKLPRLDNSVTLTSENKIIPKPDSRTPKLSRESSNSYGAIDTGNHLEILCGKFRDASLSRAAALTQTIRGSSLLDVDPSFAFPAAFIEHNKYELNEGDRELEYLSAALASDSFAGQPFCEYIRIINNDEAFANIRFWIAAQQFLSSLPQLDTLTRRRQSLALIHIYLLKDSPRKTSLSLEMMSKLCDLLPKDLGFTALTAACVNCAKALTPTWKEFLLLDEGCFHAKVASRLSSSLLSKSSAEKTTKKDHFHPLKKKKREKLPPTRIWNALQLAIAISVPRTAKPLLEGYEEADENPDPIRDYQGSLESRQLRVLNRQAIRALEHYRNSNPYQSGMAYYCYHQNLLLSTMGNNANKGVPNMVTTEVPTKHYRDSKPRLPKPRVFQEILHDPIQFDAFKTFLMKHHGELPLVFWTAVESMRTNTREPKQRQLRANGILRRFFGASTNQGKDLACDADIIKELPYMDKVTSAMLVSAQTCVARSMEEKWLIAYLSTFPEEDELPGITKLPHFRPLQATGEPGRGMKHQIRLLWRAFTRNVISFRRGIANHKTLKHFQNFLKLQHVINIKRSKEQGEEQPQRVLISSKLVHTDRLIHDLRFWSEVERYKEFADAVVLCAKLGNYNKDDELIVTKKGKALVNCFIDSLVPPRIQINVSTDTADNILCLVKNDIIERSLFHSAAISVFSILLHYWKKFCYHRLLPLTTLPRCPESAKSDRSNQIAVRKDAIRKNFMRRVSMQPDEEYTKIMFSLQNGLRIAVVPLEQDISCVAHKLPKINPFKLSKIARNFNIN